jgi:hypothetical protein
MVIHRLPQCISSHILFVQCLLHQVALEYRSQTVWFFWATVLFYEINQVLPVPHIWVRSLELHAGCLVIVAIWHSMNHNHESSTLQIWEGSSLNFAHALTQIRCRLHVASPSLPCCIPKLCCAFLQIHLHPMLLNPFGSIDIVQRQPGLERIQNIGTHCLPLQGPIVQLFQMGLSLDNRPMLLPNKPRHPYVLPLVERTNVGLPHAFGKLLQGVFRFLQAD